MRKNEKKDFYEEDLYGYEKEDKESLEKIIDEIATPKSEGYALLSLIFGIFSVVCCFVGWAGLTTGVIAIVLAVMSRRHLGYFDTMTVIGLILGICGAVFGILTIAFAILLTTEEFMIEFEKIIDDLGGEIDLNSYT